jgi:uncharacterized protein (TIGR02145 family)
MANIIKISLSAALAVAPLLLVSCGEHSFFDELLGLSSSSGEFSSSGGELSSSSGNGNFSYGSLMYEGKTYKTIVISSQTWMAENLNYAAPGSKCGGEDGSLKDENTQYCDKYGRLYNWATAITVCPAGWHLPSRDDWAILLKFAQEDNGDIYGSEQDINRASIAGKYLKTTSGWNSYENESGNGEDKYGFAALPGGYGSEDGGLNRVGSHGFWWNTFDYGSGSGSSSIAGYRSAAYNSKEALHGSFNKRSSLNVRCVED